MTTENNLKFKTTKQETEFGELQTKNPGLYNIGVTLSVFVKNAFNKDVVVTDVFRTKEEFDALYAATPIEKRPKDSPHCHYNAFDLRSRLYTEAEIRQLLNYLNNNFKNPSGLPIALYHKIAGNVEHFHIQYSGSKV